MFSPSQVSFSSYSSQQNTKLLQNHAGVCEQKRGFLPKVWLHCLERDLHAVSILRLRTAAAFEVPLLRGDGPHAHLLNQT